MERNEQGQIISLTNKESDLRDAHLNILRTQHHIAKLEKEIMMLEKVKQELLNKGTTLYLLEWDIKQIEAGICP
jgi:hypothetical protein